MTADQQLIYDRAQKDGRITESEARTVLAHVKQFSYATDLLKAMVKDGLLSKKDYCYTAIIKKKAKIDQPKMF